MERASANTESYYSSIMEPSRPPLSERGVYAYRLFDTMVWLRVTTAVIGDPNPNANPKPKPIRL